MTEKKPTVQSKKQSSRISVSVHRFIDYANRNVMRLLVQMNHSNE